MLCASYDNAANASYDNAAKDTSPNNYNSVQFSATSSLLNSQICASNDFGITLLKKNRSSYPV